RPVLANVFALVIMLLGGVALFNLPVAQYPPITPPTIQVTTNYPGASAKTMVETVALPIEQQVNGVENMLYMQSTCTSDGRYTLTITFKVGTDLNFAQVLVQNRVSAAVAQLPPAVQQQGVVTKKKSTAILQIITLTSPDAGYDTLFLSNFATLKLRDTLARVEGVSDVNVFGIGQYSMRVWLDPRKMLQRSLVPSDVVAAIQKQSTFVSAGQINMPPASPGEDFQLTIDVKGNLSTATEFENVIVKYAPDSGGQITRLRDIGRIELGAQTYSQFFKMDGDVAGGIAIYQLPEANALDTAKRVRATMAVMGFSINLLTLFAVVLAIGIVVDDAIVVVEGVSQHVERGQSPKEASIKAMRELFGPIIGITLVLMSVFVPPAFMPGITGQMYRQFALVIAATALISAINAVTLKPTQCALWLRQADPTRRKNIFFRGFNAVYVRVERIYLRVIGGMVRRSRVMVLLALVLVVLGLWGLTKIPSGFIPAEDQGYLMAAVQTPDAASLGRIESAMDEIARIGLKTPGVERAIAIGTGGPSPLEGDVSLANAG